MSAINPSSSNNSNNYTKVRLGGKIVEMDGDEMAKVIFGLIRDKLVLPFVDIKTEYFDLGLDNRDAIGAITGALSQLVYKSYLRKFVQQNVKGFDLTPEYIAAYTKFLDDWQDPETGFWGEWYQSGGKLYKSCDLSLTFHTVSYRKGKVNHIDQLIETLFAIKEKTYPFGWLWDGHFNNHNNYARGVP